MPSSSSREIFLSHWREDARSAHILQDRLRERIPDTRVFADLGSAAGIRNLVGSCAVLVALIGPQWAFAADPKGHRRLYDPNDLVRLAIQTALEHDVRVIPVLIGGTRMPRQQELPSGLHKLTQLQALKLSEDRSGRDFEIGVNVLIEAIERVLPAKPDEGQATATGPSTPPTGTRWLRGARPRGVFISYRRKLSEHLARSVYSYLDGHDYDAFVDLKNLDSGEFEQVILSQIEARQHFIVVLQPGSLNQIGKDGDWLRLEIAHALAHRRNVVPVTADGFEFRHDLVLPPDVAKLPSFNAVSIPPGYFDEAMDRLRTRFLKMPSNR